MFLGDLNGKVQVLRKYLLGKLVEFLGRGRVGRLEKEMILLHKKGQIC